MLNGSRQLKGLWILLGSVPIGLWVVAIFAHAGTETVMAATAGMLLGVIVLSVNAAALAEEVLGHDVGESH